MQKFFLTLVFLLTIGLLGCGTSNVPAKLDFVEVKGTVNGSDGKPLANGSIHFSPAVKSAIDDQVIVIKDGNFSAKIPAGEYKVAFNIPNEGDRAKAAPGVPTKYTAYATAQLTASVKSGMQPLSYDLK